jgi:hypothetical protein
MDGGGVSSSAQPPELFKHDGFQDSEKDVLHSEGTSNPLGTDSAPQAGPSRSVSFGIDPNRTDSELHAERAVEGWSTTAPDAATETLPEGEPLDWDQYIFTVDNRSRHLLTCAEKRVSCNACCVPGQPLQLKFARLLSTKRLLSSAHGSCSRSRTYSASQHTPNSGSKSSDWFGDESSTLVHQIEEILNARRMHELHLHAEGVEDKKARERQWQMDAVHECTPCELDPALGCGWPSPAEVPCAQRVPNECALPTDKVSRLVAASLSMCSTTVWLSASSHKPNCRLPMKLELAHLSVQKLQLPPGLLATLSQPADTVGDASKMQGNEISHRDVLGSIERCRQHQERDTETLLCGQADLSKLGDALGGCSKVTQSQGMTLVGLTSNNSFETECVDGKPIQSNQHQLVEGVARAHLRSACKRLQTARTAKLSPLLRR